MSHHYCQYCLKLVHGSTRLRDSQMDSGRDMDNEFPKMIVCPNFDFDNYSSGTVIDGEMNLESSDEEDDIPLARLAADDEDDMPLARLFAEDDTDVPLASHCTLTNVPLGMFPTRDENGDTVSLPDDVPLTVLENGSSAAESAAMAASTEPSSFQVDGAPREDTEEPRPEQQTLSKRKSVKWNRNRGKPYQSEKSGRLMPARSVRGRCASDQCHKRGLHCDEIGKERQEALLSSYYSMVSLSEQRHWIRQHIKSSTCQASRVENSKRQMTNVYYLPDEEGNELEVCQSMFLSTLDISQKQVRTVLSKTSVDGVLDGERRGGRVQSQRDRDEQLRRLVLSHINQFPRVESHYCRRSSGRQYLHPELTVSRMFKMFTQKHADLQCSYDLYLKVFKSQNLAFHVPKKDMCNVCDTYHRGDEEFKKKYGSSVHNPYYREERGKGFKS